MVHKSTVRHQKRKKAGKKIKGKNMGKKEKLFIHYPIQIGSHIGRKMLPFQGTHWQSSCPMLFINVTV
jgi:hypothetical protein